MDRQLKISKNELTLFEQIEDYIGIQGNYKTLTVEEIKSTGRREVRGGKSGSAYFSVGGTEEPNVKNIDNPCPELTYSIFKKSVNSKLYSLHQLGYSNQEININYFLDLNACNGEKYGRIICLIETSFSKDTLIYDLFFIRSSHSNSDYDTSTYYSYFSKYIFAHKNYSKHKNEKGLIWQKQFNSFIDKYHFTYQNIKKDNQSLGGNNSTVSKSFTIQNSDSQDDFKLPIILWFIIFGLLFYFERGIITLVFFFIGAPLFLFSYRLVQVIRRKS